MTIEDMNAIAAVEKDLEEAPETMEFVASYETMIVPSGAPKSTVCILVDSYGEIAIGVSYDGEGEAKARENALAP